MSDSENKICGECARYKVPDSGCPNYNSFYEFAEGKPLMDADSEACSEFHKVKGKKKGKEKKNFKDSGVFEDKGCFEAIYHNNKPSFIIYHENVFEIIDAIKSDKESFYPKELKQIPYQPYDYFEGSVLNREELFWKVRSEIDTFIDVEPIWKDVLASCVLLTYQQEKLHSVPYIFLYGDNESGKSTVLKVLNKLCYRPLYGVTIPSADLFGYLEDSDSIGCIFEDEVQGIDKDTDKIKIYKAGYTRGATVPRIITTPYDKYIKYYNTFCFKVCASEQIPWVKGFNERFVFIPMVEGFPQKEWSDITKEDVKRLDNLRNMLLKWRMLSSNWELPEVQLSIKGRLKELWKPLLQVTHGLTVYDTLSRFVEDQRKERLSGKQDTLEGKIVKVVVEIFNDGKIESLPTVPFSTIWDYLKDELNGSIDGVKSYVMHTSEFDEVTKNKIGYRLREVLSGKSNPTKEKDSEGKWVSIRAYEFNIEKLKRIAKKYDYDFSTKLPSLPSSRTLNEKENMEKDNEKHGENNTSISLELSKLSNSVEKGIALTRLPKGYEAEKCELCGLFPVEFQFILEGQIVKRCGHCIQTMKDHGFKFKEVK